MSTRICVDDVSFRFLCFSINYIDISCVDSEGVDEWIDHDCRRIAA